MECVTTLSGGCQTWGTRTLNTLFKRCGDRADVVNRMFEGFMFLFLRKNIEGGVGKLWSMKEMG